MTTATEVRSILPGSLARAVASSLSVRVASGCSTWNASASRRLMWSARLQPGEWFHVEHGGRLQGRQTSGSFHVEHRFHPKEWVPRGTPPHPGKSVPRGTHARVARERSSPRLTGHSVPPVPPVAEDHRRCRTRRLHREPKAPLSPRCFGRSGDCQRSNTFRETAAQSGRMTRNFWAGRGMANQRATARWSQVMRVDQSRGGGMAMVAWLAPHDPKSRLRACRTFPRA